MENIIGIDLGGTNIKAALVTIKGKVIKKYELATEVNKGTKNVIKNIFFAIRKVKEGKILGIGFGSPGPMDYKKGIITNPINLPFRNTPLKKIIQNKFKLPTFLDNDANCFALAEAVFGQGRKYENVVGITLGTGIGGGFVINKKIYHGRNNAAELGHITINYDGAKSGCGNNGCIETYTAARGIIETHNNESNPYLVYKLALEGDIKAIKSFKKMGYYLGIGLTNIIYAFDPDIIIIGGKISNAWTFFYRSMKNEIKKRYFAKPPKIVKSNLKEAGILGAAALVLENS